MGVTAKEKAKGEAESKSRHSEQSWSIAPAVGKVIAGSCDGPASCYDKEARR
jgi:hypothetical protein